MRELVGGGELLLGVGRHVGLDDVEADPQHRVGQAHPHHGGNQDQLPRQSETNCSNPREDYFILSSLSPSPKSRRKGTGTKTETIIYCQD